MELIIGAIVVLGFGFFIYKKVKGSDSSSGSGGGRPSDGGKQQQK